MFGFLRRMWGKESRQAAWDHIVGCAESANAMPFAEARGRARELLAVHDLFTQLEQPPGADLQFSAFWQTVPPFRTNRAGIVVSPEYVAPSRLEAGLVRIGADLELEGWEVAMDPKTGRIVEMSEDVATARLYKREFPSIDHYIVFLACTMS